MPITDYFYIAGSIITSVGGASVIIIGLSSFLGKVWANRILEQDKLKYKTALENTKSKYQKELEEYKQELEKSKLLYARYSEFQFKLYNDLWSTLCKLKLLSNELWSKANIENARAFALHLDKTINTVENHRLLIEDRHYDQLKAILNIMNDFKISKYSLISLRQMTDDQIKMFRNEEIELLINRNRENKKRYDDLLEVLAKAFKKQIRAT